MTSKTMVCDLAILSASSLGTCSCILSGPTDLKLSVSFIGLKPDLFLESVIPSSPIPSLPLLSLVWVSHLPSEDWGKAVVVYLSLVLVPSNQFSYTTLKYLNKHMKKNLPNAEPLALQGYLSPLVIRTVLNDWPLSELVLFSQIPSPMLSHILLQCMVLLL